MRTIRFPYGVPAPLDVLVTGLGAGKTLTDRQRRAIEARYWRYLLLRGRADLLPSSPAFKGALGQAICKAYEQTYTGKRLADLRARMFAAVANRCPSCGGTRPRTLDHHLPQARYAEFALFPGNLSGCCHECNQKKSAKASPAPEEAFIHPYLDEVPDVVIHKVTLMHSPETIVVQFEFDGSRIEDPLLAERMAHQFRTVDVDARIASEAQELMTEIASIILTDCPGGNPALVAATVAGQAVRRGWCQKSDWRPALLDALASDADFCGGGYRRFAPRLLPR